MKKNRNGIILIAEIVAIVLFHAFKTREPQKELPLNTIVKVGKTLENIPRSSLILKAKPEYFFVNMFK
jgi:hypothetical protein